MGGKARRMRTARAESRPISPKQDAEGWKANPVIHPEVLLLAFVAHLDRVTDFESVGSLFESGRTQ